MKKNVIISISLFFALTFSCNSLTHPFSWLYDSGKEYLSTVSDVDFWKGACCVVVGLFAVEKCAPLAKKTFNFIFRIPKKETEIEKVARVIKKQTKMQKKIAVCTDGLVKLCKCYKKNKVGIINIESKLSTLLKHFDKNIKYSTSSSSEDDDSEELERRKPIYGLNRYNVPLIDLGKRRNVSPIDLDFNALHRRIITSSNSPNLSHHSSGGSHDASDESSSSSDDDEESPKTITPTSSSRSSGDSFQSDSIIILNSDDSEHEYEEIIDEDGVPEGYKKSPRREKTLSNNSRVLMRALGGDALRSPQKSTGSPLKTSETKNKRQKGPSLGISASLPPSVISRKIKPLEKSHSLNLLDLHDNNDNDDVDNDEDNADFMMTEDGEHVSLSLPTPITPRTDMLASFQDLGTLQGEGSSVEIGKQEGEKIALQRYYADKPEQKKNDKKCLVN